MFSLLIFHPFFQGVRVQDCKSRASEKSRVRVMATVRVGDKVMVSCLGGVLETAAEGLNVDSTYDLLVICRVAAVEV